MLIPAVGVLGIIATSLPGAALAGWLFGANVGWLFLLTSGAYVTSYELTHLAYHLPAHSFIGRRAFVRAMREHHARHHDPRLMQKWNFNVTLPLADWIFRTYASRELLDEVREEVRARWLRARSKAPPDTLLIECARTDETGAAVATLDRRERRPSASKPARQRACARCKRMLEKDQSDRGAPSQCLISTRSQTGVREWCGRVPAHDNRGPRRRNSLLGKPARRALSDMAQSGKRSASPIPIAGRFCLASATAPTPCATASAPLMRWSRWARTHSNSLVQSRPWDARLCGDASNLGRDWSCVGQYAKASPICRSIGIGSRPQSCRMASLCCSSRWIRVRACRPEALKCNVWTQDGVVIFRVPAEGDRILRVHDA